MSMQLSKIIGKADFVTIDGHVVVESEETPLVITLKASVGNDVLTTFPLKHRLVTDGEFAEGELLVNLTSGEPAKLKLFMSKPMKYEDAKEPIDYYMTQNINLVIGYDPRVTSIPAGWNWERIVHEHGGLLLESSALNEARPIPRLREVINRFLNPTNPEYRNG